MYADNEACVATIMANLEGEATEWVVSLHNEGAPKLEDLDVFLGELRAQFGDTKLR